MTTNKFTLVTIVVMAFFAVVGYVVYLQLNPSDASQVNNASDTSLGQSPESFEVGNQEELVPPPDIASDSPPASTEIVSNTYSSTGDSYEWRDDIRVSNSVSYSSAYKSVVPKSDSTSSEGGNLVSPIPDLVSPSVALGVEGYSDFYDTLEKIRLQQEAFTAEALVPDFDTLGVSLSGYEKCGTIPEIDNNQSFNEYVNELQSDSALLCLGEAYATGCTSAVAKSGAGDVYLTQVSDKGCTFIRVFDVSEFDSGFDEIINVCSVSLPDTIPDGLKEVGVEVTANIDEVFTLVGDLADMENKLKSLKSSSYQNTLEISKLENEIDSLNESLSDVGELSDEEYYSIATIVSSGYDNCTSYSR